MPFFRESIVSTLDLDTFENTVTEIRAKARIVSTLDLDTFEN